MSVCVFTKSCSRLVSEVFEKLVRKVGDLFKLYQNHIHRGASELANHLVFFDQEKKYLNKLVKFCVTEEGAPLGRC